MAMPDLPQQDAETFLEMTKPKPSVAEVQLRIN